MREKWVGNDVKVAVRRARWSLAAGTRTSRLVPPVPGSCHRTAALRRTCTPATTNAKACGSADETVKRVLPTSTAAGSTPLLCATWRRGTATTPACSCGVSSCNEASDHTKRVPTPRPPCPPCSRRRVFLFFFNHRAFGKPTGDATWPSHCRVSMGSGRPETQWVRQGRWWWWWRRRKGRRGQGEDEENGTRLIATTPHVLRGHEP